MRIFNYSTNKGLYKGLYIGRLKIYKCTMPHQPAFKLWIGLRYPNETVLWSIDFFRFGLMWLRKEQ